MNRRSILAGLMLVLMTGLLALRTDPVVAPGSFPAALELPETLVVSATAEPPGFGLGLVLLGLSAVSLLCWRRLMGLPAGLALLPGLLLLAHPALLGAVLSGPGRLDLAALLLLLLGATLIASERSGKLAAGIVLLIVSVLGAPSGGPLSALAAFVLLERVPAMQKGALLLMMCGAARALGAPSILTGLLDDVPAGAGGLAAGAFTVESLLSLCAALLPARPVVWLPGAEPPAVGLGLLLLLGIGVLLLFPERRFGGRWAALLCLASLGLLALSTSRGEPAGPAALAAPLVLLGCWLAGLGESVKQGLFRPALPWSLGLGLLVFLGLRTVSQVELFGSRTAFFRALAAPDPVLAERGGLALAALRAELAGASPEQIRVLALERLAAHRPRSSDPARIDREFAIAAAGSGSLDPALRLIERAVGAVGAAESGSGLSFSIRLDQADLMLRAGLPDRALLVLEQLLSRPTGAGWKAQILARRALSHAQLAFQGPDTAADRELAAARRDFAAAVEADPECARAHLDRGRFELALGEVIQAIKSLEAAARLRPDVAAPRLELAKLYFSRGQPEAGERELTIASGLTGTTDPEVVLVTAQLQLARGDLAGAVKNASWLTERIHGLQGGAQSLSGLYRMLALSAEDGRNLGVAEAMAHESLRLGSDRDGRVTACLLRILRQDRRYDELVSVLERAERDATPVEGLQQELSQALKNAGYARFVAKDRASAWNRFLESCRRSPDFRDLGAIPTLLQSLSGQRSEEELQLLAGEARRAFELGLSAISKSDFQQARRLLQISIEMLPQNPFAHYHLGLALDRLGELDAAREAYERALRYAQALKQDELTGRLRKLLGT